MRRPAHTFLVLFLILLLAPALAPALHRLPEGWQKLASPQLEVWFPPGLDRTAAEVMERSARYLEETSAFLDLSFTEGHTIILADSDEEFIRQQPGRIPAPEWAGALTYPSARTVLIKTPGAMGVAGGPYWSLLRHEMVHLVVGEAELARGMRFPKWFAEGLATYVAGEMTLSRLLTLGWMQATGTVPGFDELEGTFPRDPEQAEAAYGRSYLFIKYLTGRFGDDAAARLLERALAEGSLERGVVAAFGVTMGEIMVGFDQYSRVKATWVPAIFSTASLWMLITMLFLLAYIRKKVAEARTLSRWQREEDDIYGTGDPASPPALRRNGLEGEDHDDLGDQKPTLH